MKQIIPTLLLSLFMLVFTTSCSEKIETEPIYHCLLEMNKQEGTMPQGTKVAISCTLTKNPFYTSADNFEISYNQNKGIGKLEFEDGTDLADGVRYPIENDNFTLYYTTIDGDVQLIEVYIHDEYGNSYKHTAYFTISDPLTND